MARLREVYSIQDMGFLDEPVLVSGPLYLSFRKLLYLSPLVLIGFVLRKPTAMPLPGLPIGLDQLLIIGVVAGLAILGLAPRKAIPIEQQLLGIFSPGSRGRKKQPLGRELVIKADVLPYTMEISGYAIDPKTGEPLDTTVLIIVDGDTVEAKPNEKGRYSINVELGPGLHDIVVELKEPRVKLKELKVRVEPK